MIKKSIWQLVSKDQEKYSESNRVKKKKFVIITSNKPLKRLKQRKVKNKRGERESAKNSL